MIHDIEPHQFDNTYIHKKPQKGDYLLYYRENHVFLIHEDELLRIPKYHEFLKITEMGQVVCEYLFCIDEHSYFLVLDNLIEKIEEQKMYKIDIFREIQPKHMSFAGVTGAQVYRWRKNRRFCGHCGGKMDHSVDERALICNACGLIEYPKISPAVIVAIVDGDKLLMTKYANGNYKKYALVAGFVEIGESFEAAVQREVFEEVGLRVKNIQYYKSQPWAFSDSEMIGYFAELDGDNKVTLQEEELSEAVWFSREEIPVENSNFLSISHEMIDVFRKGQ